MNKEIRQAAKAYRLHYLDAIISDGSWDNIKKFRKEPKISNGKLRNLNGNLVKSEQRGLWSILNYFRIMRQYLNLTSNLMKKTLLIKRFEMHSHLFDRHALLDLIICPQTYGKHYCVISIQLRNCEIYWICVGAISRFQNNGNMHQLRQFLRRAMLQILKIIG